MRRDSQLLAPKANEFYQVNMAEEEQVMDETGSGQNVEKMELDSRQSTQIPRLMIPKIVIENFKSYAGVQVLGPFHKVRDILIFNKTL